MRREIIWKPVQFTVVMPQLKSKANIGSYSYCRIRNQPAQCVQSNVVQKPFVFKVNPRLLKHIGYAAADVKTSPVVNDAIALLTIGMATRYSDARKSRDLMTSASFRQCVFDGLSLRRSLNAETWSRNQ
jgi:hypothetical protein